MNKSEKLKNAILEQYKSIREFSKVVDIPNSTIVSAIDNGIRGMAVDKVIRICEALNLDVKTFDKTPVSRDIITDQENFMLSIFNKLNELGQQEANKRIEELTYIDKYKKTDKIINIYAHRREHTEKAAEIPTEYNVPDHLKIDAANTIEGSSDEDKQRDNESIMDDPNF
ncbi:helix-turn-helix transcriptional regulator [Sedimentibacter sp.]|uniref:helix-turn-helix domain-containing protein n=1 Tax=Sedimentibacter sp. TaxID=1960295 RepID=UPI0028ACA806|nr:helix-turn-helix transcriptional regulator [Sedimentibacter sp.]